MLRLSSILLFLVTVFPQIGEGGSEADFVRDVKPIFKAHCVECHSADDRNGGISFQDRKSVFAEADSGERPIVAGDLDSSELLKRITTSDEDLRMPPDGETLSAEQIETLKRWISDGAKWPETDAPQEVKTTHWSFQPIEDPEVPTIADDSWSKNPIDHFIQARREAAGLAVVEDASPTVLIRRATYGLTGLPPTPEEVHQFVESVDENGLDQEFEKLVDELLSRPTYGERWGRHWMDWVRYADTAGDNSDFPIPQAYLYRNYIIESFNNDVPYDRFLTEQIAGDLLPYETLEEKNRQTIATGYLAMARRFGSLVERYPWHLTIEDTIDNVGRTMMGLTIACARCHDHKFDPISTRDYYGLYGIFESTRYPFPGIELFQTQNDLVSLISEEKTDEMLAPFQAETDKLTKEMNRLLIASEKKALENARKETKASIDEQRKMRDELDAMLIKARRAGEKLADHLKKIPPMPTAYAVQDAQPQNAQIQIKGEPTRPGAVVPRKFPEVLGGQRLADEIALESSGRLQLAEWLTDPNNPLTARVIVNRIWQRHFGTGIVPSTSDFGLRGQEPTHPELLDWLATEFMENGWSIKHLHRTIMNSRTYRLSSSNLEENLKSDPSNAYYWKFNRQRLDAESIRDTLLSISGTLDTTPQTEPYPIPPSAEWKYTQHHPYKDEYPTNKRSVYQMTKRLTVQRYMQTFDGPDPNVCTSSRDESVTPLQALYFVNDEFLHEQAKRYAERLCENHESDEARVNHAFETILCREPTPRESVYLLNHLAAVREQDQQDSVNNQNAEWSSLVRSLFRLNEFLYID